MAAAAVPPKATGRCAGAPWPQQLRGRAARRRAPRSSYDGAIGGEGGQSARSTDARLVSVAKLAPPTRQRHAPAAEDTIGNDDSNRLPVFGLARVRSGDLGSLILTVELPCVQSRDVRVDVQVRARVNRATALACVLSDRLRSDSSAAASKFQLTPLATPPAHGQAREAPDWSGGGVILTGFTADALGPNRALYIACERSHETWREYSALLRK